MAGTCQESTFSFFFLRFGEPFLILSGQDE